MLLYIFLRLVLQLVELTHRGLLPDRTPAPGQPSSRSFSDPGREARSAAATALAASPAVSAGSGSGISRSRAYPRAPAAAAAVPYPATAAKAAPAGDSRRSSRRRLSW